MLTIPYIICYTFILSSDYYSATALPASSEVSETIQTSEKTLDKWVPPKNISKLFPYYISGFDFDSRPFFVVEIGKWPFRDFIEKGKDLEVLDKYVQQMFYRFEYGGKIYSRPGEENQSDESAGILDWEGFSLVDYAHSPTLKFLLKHFASFQKIQDSHAYGLWINVNAVARSFINLATPVLGNVLERIEIYGTQKSRWIPKVLRRIDKDEIPSWYGGTKDSKEFQPVAIFG
ncbi:unnamed protein product [Allacma fusca]|uniref:CRAL-TRIO domain-containing protein n=1 Tax=Allacma fusca TaxID=39272 RepID=A0A8J2JPG4_9HEXA|nr:unnamed protein product [Allacma fusca]